MNQQRYVYGMVAIVLIGILYLNMLPLLFATILTYLAIVKSNNLILKIKNKHKTTAQYNIKRSNLNMISTLLVISVVVVIITLMCLGIYQALHGDNLTKMMQWLSIILEENKNNQNIPTFIAQYIPQNTVEIKNYFIDILKEYGNSITQISKNSIKAFVYILIGIILGAMLSFHSINHVKNENMPPFKRQIIDKVIKFKNNFETVFIAQVKISLIDTIITGIYLYLILPIFGIDIPFKATVLIIAFIVGLIPVVGNLISNTIIIVLSLGFSIYVAIASLTFLVVIHKLEYFLNAKIIGNQIQSTAWELLLAMLVAERIFGIGGLIVAPIYYAYIKDELEENGLI